MSQVKAKAQYQDGALTKFNRHQQTLVTIATILDINVKELLYSTKKGKED